MTCSQLWKLILGVLEPQEKTESEDADSEGKAPSESAGADYEARFLSGLETAVRTLIPLGILYDQAGTDLRAFPLTEQTRFPLPPRFVSAAVYLTGYLLSGDTRLYNLYSNECEGIKREIPTEVSPTVQAYGA